MSASPRIDPRITCPVCDGTGQDSRQARRYSKGMNHWIETTCTCCHGDGRVTRERLQFWLDTKHLREQAGRKAR